MTHHVKPRLLLLEGAPGSPAIANRIVGRYFHLGNCTVPMIPYPGFGFLLGIHVSSGISCFSTTVDEAIQEFKFFFHVKLLMEASVESPVPRRFTARIHRRSAAEL